MKVVVSSLVVLLSVYLEASPLIIDINQDGVYDRNEFHWAFPDADLYQEFARADTDKDGLITGEEADLASINHQQLDSEEGKIMFILIHN